MARVFIIYHSVTGTTAALAEAIGKGVLSQHGAELGSYRITGKDIVDGRFVSKECLAQIDAASAVIFGCPTFMGGPSAQFKSFADATGDLWFGQRWQDKLAAGFTVGSGLSGDKLATLSYFSVFAAQHGMLWVSLGIADGADELGRNRLGSYLGAMGQTSDGTLPPVDLQTAEHLGARVAALALRFAAGKG